MVRAIRFTEPTCRFSFEVISRIGAPSRTSRISACFSATVHSFGFGFIALSSQPNALLIRNSVRDAYLSRILFRS